MKYELRLVKILGDNIVPKTVATWNIPEIITDKEGQAKKVKFLPALSRIKRAIKEDVAKGIVKEQNNGTTCSILEQMGVRHESNQSMERENK